MTKVKIADTLCTARSTMTEVRDTKHGRGLFATQEFSPGDIVLADSTPLAVLSPVCHQQEDDILQILLKDDTKSATRKSLWEAILVPQDVDGSMAGNFRGMVQAALCFLHSPPEPPVETELLKLYCPSLSLPNEKESAIVKLSTQAMDCVESHCHTKWRYKESLEKKREIIQKIMLIWNCNSFEGGRIYGTMSRINHSCDPNAVVKTQRKWNSEASNNNNGQEIRAAAPIAVGDEICISYLGQFLYADAQTRRSVLVSNKHFLCCCSRCVDVKPDPATWIPCPRDHPRLFGRQQLDEDTQYDDEQQVRYVACPTGTCAVTCEHCQTTFRADDDENDSSKFRNVFEVAQNVTDKVVRFLRDAPAKGRTADTSVSDDDQTTDEESEMLKEHLRMASCVLGARHWTTNLTLLMHLDEMLQGMHAKMLADQSEPDMEAIAEAIDSLQRIFRFQEDLGLRLHAGHLLSDVAIGVARALVSLGDIKSQKYAAEWLEKVDEYVQSFECEGIQKVVSTLKVAWQKDAPTGEKETKRARLS